MMGSTKKNIAASVSTTDTAANMFTLRSFLKECVAPATHGVMIFPPGAVS